MQQIGPAAVAQLKERIARELRTTFLSEYSTEISLIEALRPEVIAAYTQRHTGRKYLINPNKNGDCGCHNI